MEYISFSFFHLFIITIIFFKSFARNKTNIYSINIIKFNQKYFRYVNFAENSKGDLIFYSTATVYNTSRLFYGLTKNGRPLFENNSYFHILKSRFLQKKNLKVE